MSASEQNYANGRQTATISVGNEGVKDASGFTVDVYEDDDWIDTVDVMKVLLQEKKKRLKLHFQNPYRKKCKHTGLLSIKMKIAIQKIMNRKLNSDMQMFR